jgi:hypothetical protein
MQAVSGGRRGYLAALLAITALVLVTTVAWSPWARAEARLIHVGAGKASCPSGYVCAWESDWYAGRGVGMFNDEPWYENFPAEFKFIQNNADSFYNNGRTHDVRFGRHGYLDGGTFVLCRGDSISYTPTARSDGANPGLRWWNEASSHDWFTSVWC